MAEFSMIDQEDRDQKICEVAFRLWQIDGGSGGLHQQYLEQAAKIVDEQLADQNSSKATGQAEPDEEKLASRPPGANTQPAPQGGERRRYPGSGRV